GGERTFERIGKAVADEFLATADADKLKTHLMAAKQPLGKTEEWEPPATTEIFRTLVEPGARAVRKGMGVAADGENEPEPGADRKAADFRGLLSQEDTLAHLETKLLDKQEQAALADLAESEQEIDEYERQLTMVDGVGDVAGQGKIIRLIQELKR